MRYFQIFVACALIVCLIMNAVLFSKLNTIENQLNNSSSYQHQILNSVNGQTSNIQSVMEDIHREQSWISYVRMDVETVEGEEGRGNAIFEWQIKELPTNADVVFNYSLGESETYSSVSAEELQNGLFRVTVPFEMVIEPNWEVYVYSREGMDGHQTAVEEVKEEQYRQTELKYYVSMSTEGMVKSGIEEITNLGYFGSRFYGGIMIDISGHDDRYFISVNSDNFDSANYPEEVYVLSYKDGVLSEERQLNTATYDDDGNSEHHYHFHLENPLEKDSFTELTLKVVYSNGEVFEKDIW
ncbi:hypothetical protein ACERII_12715 [Evansella sp. AB-rgal1]|uniref:hypothetical protein n=1 Tax=Evansella sp. AB-rgal1 TaxID=3242696 RepID=UPI00359E8308